MKSEFRAVGSGALIYGKYEHHRVIDAKFDSSTLIEERIGRGLSELLHLERHWRTLCAISTRTRFIHMFEWQLAYLKHLENNPESIYYVSFFANGRAIAIFPLRRVRRSVGYISHWLWELPTHPHLVLGEPLISPEWASAKLIERLVGTLDRCENLPWDALHLPNLLDDSMVLRMLSGPSRSWTHLEQTGQSMYFQCSDMERAFANSSKQFRRNLRRQSKRLKQYGAVSLSLLRQGEELDAAFDDFLRLEASGWKGEGGRASAISLHANLLGFYRELKDDFAKIGGCLIALLRLDGAPIAAQFCLLVGDTLYIQKIAYDEKWHAEAPGNLLLYRLIEFCCSEPGIRELSLVTAPGWAHGRWNPECQNVWEAYVFKASPRGLGGLAMRRFKTGVGKPAQALWARARASLTAGTGSGRR